MHAIRQKCRPKHQILILKCYPKTTKGAVDVKPNSSELSYLLYYATTRRSKVQKGKLELPEHRSTLADEGRNVQVTLQILAALIEKAPRDLPLYAPSVLKILNTILRSRDITMVESSIPTFEAFCEHHDGASLSADQDYLHRYEEIVGIYASFASTRPPPSKVPVSAPLALRWRNVGLQAIQSVASSEALASVAGRQLNVVVPMLLENLWTDNGDYLDTLEQRSQLQEKEDKEKLLRRRNSVATVRTVDTADEGNIVAGTTADADKFAEEKIGVLAINCLQNIFSVNNRSQILGGTIATLQFIKDRVAQNEQVLQDSHGSEQGGWAIRILEMIARWTPVQDRYVILVTAMDILVRSPLADSNLQQQLVLATMIDSLLKSDINLIGLSVMDVLLGLIKHVLRVLQLDGAIPHTQQENGSDKSPVLGSVTEGFSEKAVVPTDVRFELLTKLQQCIGDLATHVYYADQISDMVSTLLSRLRPSPLSGIANATVAIENPAAASIAITSVGDVSEDPNTDGFFSFDTAKTKALEAIKAILIVASNRKNLTGGTLGRNRVSLRVWEGTQWLLRDNDGKVRKAYVDALLTWLDLETTRADLKIHEERPENTKEHVPSSRDDFGTSLSRRAVSNASNREKKQHRQSHSTFLQLLHLAIYENGLQFAECEADIVLLHLLLYNLVRKLGVNAVKDGLPMIFRLQEDILSAETPASKIRIGSLCHGYFWTVSESFDFDTSPIGGTIYHEITRRRNKTFWVESIRLPPLSLDQISTPGRTTPHNLPREELEKGALIPFDDRFQMVKLISLSYAESVSSPPPSAPTSPGRTPSQPILSMDAHPAEQNSTLPDVLKEQMMSEWSRELVIAVAQESTKTSSVNGSRSGTNVTGPRNFLAVNGNLNGGTNSGTQSPHRDRPQSHRSRPPSLAYGLVGGLGSVRKQRTGNGHSPSPPSESSRASVTRVDQLKRVLSGQQAGLPPTSHSDASSESMASYDFTASEVSFNPSGQQSLPQMERSVSLREPRSRSRSRSKSNERDNRPLTSHAVTGSTGPTGADVNVPPVPPLPNSLAGDSSTIGTRKSRSVKWTGKNRTTQAPSPWGEGPATVDLLDLLKGIDTSGDLKESVVKPPY